MGDNGSLNKAFQTAHKYIMHAGALKKFLQIGK